MNAGKVWLRNGGRWAALACLAVAGLMVAACEDKPVPVNLAAINLKAARFVDSPTSGALDNVWLANGQVNAVGWAMNGDTHNPPDAVVLANQKRDVLAAVLPASERPDVAKILDRPALLKSGFLFAVAPQALLSTGTTELYVFAYSARDNKAYFQGPAWQVIVEKGRIAKFTHK